MKPAIATPQELIKYSHPHAAYTPYPCMQSAIDIPLQKYSHDPSSQCQSQVLQKGREVYTRQPLSSKKIKRGKERTVTTVPDIEDLLHIDSIDSETDYDSDPDEDVFTNEKVQECFDDFMVALLDRCWLCVNGKL